MGLNKMAIALVCTLPFHGYAVGQIVSDPHLAADLLKSRDRHFVKITVADPEPQAAPEPSSSVEPEQPAAS